MSTQCQQLTQSCVCIGISITLYIQGVGLRTKEVLVMQSFGNTMWIYICPHGFFFSVLQNWIFLQCTEGRNVHRVNATQCVCWGVFCFVFIHAEDLKQKGKYVLEDV